MRVRDGSGREELQKKLCKKERKKDKPKQEGSPPPHTLLIVAISHACRDLQVENELRLFL